MALKSRCRSCRAFRFPEQLRGGVCTICRRKALCPECFTAGLGASFARRFCAVCRDRAARG